MTSKITNTPIATPDTSVDDLFADVTMRLEQLRPDRKKLKVLKILSSEFLPRIRSLPLLKLNEKIADRWTGLILSALYPRAITISRQAENAKEILSIFESSRHWAVIVEQARKIEPRLTVSYVDHSLEPFGGEYDYLTGVISIEGRRSWDKRVSICAFELFNVINTPVLRSFRAAARCGIFYMPDYVEANERTEYRGMLPCIDLMNKSIDEEDWLPHMAFPSQTFDEVFAANQENGHAAFYEDQYLQVKKRAATVEEIVEMCRVLPGRGLFKYEGQIIMVRNLSKRHLPASELPRVEAALDLDLQQIVSLEPAL